MLMPHQITIGSFGLLLIGALTGQTIFMALGLACIGGRAAAAFSASNSKGSKQEELEVDVIDIIETDHEAWFEKTAYYKPQRSVGDATLVELTPDNVEPAYKTPEMVNPSFPIEINGVEVD